MKIHKRGEELTFGVKLNNRNIANLASKLFLLFYVVGIWVILVKITQNP